MRALWLVLAFVALPAVAGIGERFVAGTHYELLPTPVSTHDPKRIEVVEVFSYVCPHCAHFDPTVAAWRARQAADVDFQRMPAVWNPLWKLFGQGYYAARSLRVPEAAHVAIFKALHVDQKRVESPQELAALYAPFGVNQADFIKAMDSFGVHASVEQASTRTGQYGVQGVPAMIVAGKYRVTGETAGSNDDMLQVVDFLVQKERDARPRVAHIARAAAPATSLNPVAKAAKKPRSSAAAH